MEYISVGIQKTAMKQAFQVCLLYIFYYEAGENVHSTNGLQITFFYKNIPGIFYIAIAERIGYSNFYQGKRFPEGDTYVFKCNISSNVRTVLLSTGHR